MPPGGVLTIRCLSLRNIIFQGIQKAVFLMFLSSYREKAPPLKALVDILEKKNMSYVMSGSLTQRIKVPIFWLPTFKKYPLGFSNLNLENNPRHPVPIPQPKQAPQAPLFSCDPGTVDPGGSPGPPSPRKRPIGQGSEQLGSRQTDGRKTRLQVIYGVLLVLVLVFLLLFLLTFFSFSSFFFSFFLFFLFFFSSFFFSFFLFFFSFFYFSSSSFFFFSFFFFFLFLFFLFMFLFQGAKGNVFL